MLRAHEVRLSAENMLDQGCRDTLLAMAASYEAMVQSLGNSLEPEMARLAGLAEDERDGRKRSA